MPMHKWEDADLYSDFPNYGLFFSIQRFGSVIPTLGINGWSRRFDESGRAHFGKNRDEIDALECSKHFRAVTFVVHRTPGSFQFSN